MLLVRTDATKAIGAGHVMRCTAIAQEAQARGIRALFLVSNDESAHAVRAQGFDVELIGGDPSLFLRVDAMNVARVAKEQRADAILIDSYAVTNGFFNQLHEALPGPGTKVAYVDDAFTFKEGFSETPAPIEADVVINYGFGFTLGAYEEIYRGSDTRLCIGPAYAPVRHSFPEVHPVHRDQVEDVLITCGMANPRGIEEKLVRQCEHACPTARITVIVGGNSPFEAPEDFHVEVRRNVESLAPYIQQADIALSASGLTLYELAASGLPTVAIPTASNQTGHALGFQNLGLGPRVPVHPIDFDALGEALLELAASKELRESYSARMRSVVDGKGAGRILDKLLASAE